MPTHLVTGAGSGIGAAIAEALSQRGDALVLLARSKERAEDLTARYPGAQAIVADLADPGGLEDALVGQQPAHALDSIIHSAGVFEFGAVADLVVDVWRELLDVNLLSPAELTRLCLPALRARRGHIVFINSGAALNAHMHKAAYAASKFGLRALADSLRSEESRFGVRVTSLYLGRVATAMQEKVHDQEGREYDPTDWIAPESVATAVLTALDLPRDAAMTDVTVSPGPR